MVEHTTAARWRLPESMHNAIGDNADQLAQLSGVVGWLARGA